jgi:hypothetical protein
MDKQYQELTMQEAQTLFELGIYDFEWRSDISRVWNQWGNVSWEVDSPDMYPLFTYRVEVE